MSSKTISLASIVLYIEEQNNLLFQLVLITITTKAKDDRKTTIEEKNLRNQLLKKEFRTRIETMIVTTITSTKISAFLNIENDEESDKISLEVKSHHVRFVNLSFEEIVRIFNEKFKLINLYKLRHMRELEHEFCENQDRIEFDENDQLKNLKKTMKIFKNFDKTFYKIYVEIFINYQLITTILFVKISLDLFATLIKYYQKILKLVKLYDWEIAMLSFVIEHHIHVVLLEIIELVNWVIDSKFQNRWCYSEALNDFKSFTLDVQSLVKKKTLLETSLYISID
jgi:hypothetical protein